MLERFEQLVECGSGDRAFARHKAGVLNLLARWKTVPDNQWLPVGWVGPEWVGIGHTKPVGNIRPIADMPDFQQGTFVWLAQREPRVMGRSVVGGSSLALLPGLGEGFG